MFGGTRGDLLDRILGDAEVVARPPVLVDVGAAGGFPARWSPFLAKSTVLAFEPDERAAAELARDTRAGRVHVSRAVATARAGGDAELYVTAFAPSSSTLRPRTDALAAWHFADWFRVVKTVRVPAVSLVDALADAGVDKIDWLKLDTQGTDLRLLTSLGDARVRRLLVAELEPGIIDAYEGEDKLWQVLREMDRLGFWTSQMRVAPVRRVPTRRAVAVEPSSVARSPGWAELGFFNSVASNALDRRDHLLGWLFASVERQHGFAVDVAAAGAERFGDAIFDELVRESARALAGRDAASRLDRARNTAGRAVAAARDRWRRLRR